MTDIDLTHNCKYGHYEKYGINDVLCCYDNKICPKRFYCRNCSGYKMKENYTTTCKNYLAKEINNG